MKDEFYLVNFVTVKYGFCMSCVALTWIQSPSLTTISSFNISSPWDQWVKVSGPEMKRTIRFTQLQRERFIWLCESLSSKQTCCKRNLLVEMKSPPQYNCINYSISQCLYFDNLNTDSTKKQKTEKWVWKNKFGSVMWRTERSLYERFLHSYWRVFGSQNEVLQTARSCWCEQMNHRPMQKLSKCDIFEEEPN